MTQLSVHRTLAVSAAKRSLVRLVRRRLDAKGKHLIGVPLQVGAAWVVIATMDDRISIDGFDALRLSDVDQVERQFVRRAFYVRGLSAKRARVPELPHLQLGSIRGLLRSAQEWFPLLVIDREEVNPGAAEIGRIVRVADSSYTMKEIDPSGDWRRSNARYHQGDVTRVGFGNEYEETLASAAGVPDPKWR